MCLNITKRMQVLPPLGDAVDSVISIVKNANHVRLGHDNSYIFSIENNRNKAGIRAITIVVNSVSGEFMGICTSGMSP